MESLLRRHWPEFIAEAAGLGLFMVSACGFAMLLFHPGSPVVRDIASPFARRALMGLAMGATAVAIIYSPWGQRSGAHLNPAVTFTFLRLRKLATGDAVCYAASQMVGGLLGVAMMAALFEPWMSVPDVNWVTTVPGSGGAAIAFVTEFTMAAGMMGLVLVVSNSCRYMRWTGLCAGVLVASYITVCAPLSGMSLNPARTLATAVPSGIWTAWWVYVTAPPLGMLLAAEVYVRTRGAVWCAKLDHAPGGRCIFCEYRSRNAEKPVPSAVTPQRGPHPRVKPSP